MNNEKAMILAKLKATNLDYLIRTFLDIFDITSGTLYDTYYRRFNNIIFNNYKEIYTELVEEIYTTKSVEMLKREFQRFRYFSCIFTFYNKDQTEAYVGVQYFDKRKGLIHKILSKPESLTNCSSILTEAEIIEKVVGFCGDYCFKDPCYRTSSGHVNTVRIVSTNDLFDLPCADNLLKVLFDYLTEYLPFDIIKPLTSLGDLLSENYTNQQNLKNKFYKWRNSSQYILASEYVATIVGNYETIHRFLEPFECLPFSVGTFFGSVFNRFLLKFIKALYDEICRIDLIENNAVVYYTMLLNLLKTFQQFEDPLYIPKEAYHYLQLEISNVGDTDCSELEADVIKEVGQTYARAIKLTELLLKRFKNFHSFTWILLENFDNHLEDQIFETWQIIHSSNCRNPEILMEEIKLLQAFLNKQSLVEIESIAAKWVFIFGKLELPTILPLVEYLLSLPASRSCVKWEQSRSYRENCLRINWRDIEKEEFVVHIEEFFNDVMADVERIVEDNEVKILVE